MPAGVFLFLWMEPETPHTKCRHSICINIIEAYWGSSLFHVWERMHVRVNRVSWQSRTVRQGCDGLMTNYFWDTAATFSLVLVSFSVKKQRQCREGSLSLLSSFCKKGWTNFSTSDNNHISSVDLCSRHETGIHLSRRKVCLPKCRVHCK